MKFALLGVAAVAATVLVAPVEVQEVIDDPGYCAQFYPNANCQNVGPGNPYTGSYQVGRGQNNDAYIGHRHWHQARRHHHQRRH